MQYATNWVQLDNSKAETALDFKFRPARETMAATVRWLYRTGKISRAQAGRAAR
jgi:hypothetical protein